jgi:translation elongation factor EF-1beta
LGGQLPSAEDREAIDALKGQSISAETHPHLFGWYSLVSKFSDDAKKTWAAAKTGAVADKAKGGKKGGKKEEPKKEAKKEAKKEDDELDLFGSDDEDDKAAAEALKKKAADAKAKKDKPKKVVIAKSLVLFEVKPYEAETKMADMAAEILKITMDGLWWKTEWKTEPIAYGVEKLIIGCTVEDEKVSVDDLQEKIEGLEDLVQSVEIIGFNKI